MKKYLILLSVLCLLLGCTAQAANGAEVEIIRVDGVSVIEIIPTDSMLFSKGTGVEEMEEAAMKLPESVTVIETEAFAGIPAKSVEVSANVKKIEARAFADCQDLSWIMIPETVETLDEKALDGCKNVTVYGKTGSEAQRFANANKAYGFVFIDPNAQESQDPPAYGHESSPAELPFIPVG